MMEWVGVDIDCRDLSMQDLGYKQKEIQKWMEKNLDDNFFCDWEFGQEESDGIFDWYLHIGLSPKDKVKFILRWC